MNTTTPTPNSAGETRPAQTLLAKCPKCLAKCRHEFYGFTGAASGARLYQCAACSGNHSATTLNGISITRRVRISRNHFHVGDAVAIADFTGEYYMRGYNPHAAGEVVRTWSTGVCTDLLTYSEARYNEPS